MGKYQCEESDYVSDTLKGLREQGCKCPDPLYYPDENDRIQHKSDKRSDSKKLFDHVKTKIKRMAISDNDRNDVYAVIENQGHIEVVSFSSSRAHHWLSMEAMTLEPDKLPSKDLIKTVLSSLIAASQFDGNNISKIYTRIAQLDGEIWYDLGRNDRKSILINKQGFGITNLTLVSPLFRTPQTLQEQVFPKLDNSRALDQYCDLLLINNADRILFKVTLVCLFLPNIPTPMIIQDGSAGTFKTTTGGSIKRVVDPSGQTIDDNVSSMQKNNKDLSLQLANRYLVSFDNVSQITQEQSDILCRAITGSSIQNRKLYTDSEEVIQSFKRKIILNGIIPNTNYPDLQTRSIKILRDVPDNVKRITEKEFDEKFVNLLPDILGQIFRLLSKALSWYNSLKYDVHPKTRMSDFEVWGEIISQILGYEKNEFTNRYHEKLKDDIIHSEDAYPIVTAILNLMENRDSCSDTVANIYKDLRMRAESLGIDIKSPFVRFPKGSNKLRAALIEVKPILDVNRITFDFHRYNENKTQFTKGSIILSFSKQESQRTLDVSSLRSP